MTNVRAPDCRLARSVTSVLMSSSFTPSDAARAGPAAKTRAHAATARGKARFRSHVSRSGGVSVLSIDVYHGISRKNAKYRIVPTCAMRVSVSVGVCMPR